MVDISSVQNLSSSSNKKKGKVSLLGCTICYQEFSSSSNPQTVKKEPEDKATLIININNDPDDEEDLKRVLCDALKIKIDRKYSTDKLQLCSRCKDIVTKLRDIDQELRKLQELFKERAESLRNLVEEGAKNAIYGAADGESVRNGDNDEDIATHFRRQVLLGSKIEKPKKKEFDEVINNAATNAPANRRPQKKTEKSRKAPAAKAKQVVSPESDSPVRRSRRNLVKDRIKLMISQKKQSVCNSNNKDSEQDEVTKDVGGVVILNEAAIKTDATDSDNFDNGYIPECPDISDNTNDLGIKSEIEVKQECVSELESDFAWEPVCKSKDKRDHKAEIDQKTKSESPKRALRTRAVQANKRRRQSSKVEESTGDSDYNTSDVEESRDEFTTEDDDEPKKPRPARKWKSVKKENRLWYDGIEVFILDGGYKCSKCDTLIDGAHDSKNRGKMKKHIIVKHLVKFSCIICNKITSSQKYLDQHIRMVHEKSVTVLCEICGKPFTSVNAMNRHKWNHQSAEEKQAAIAAGKKQYDGRANLRPLVCKICGRVCKGPYNLKRHEETHIDQKERQKHMCSFCGSIYSAPESLRSHIKLAHENNNQLQWLQCPHCPKKYPQHGLLDKHMRVHTGDKPFVCEECGTGFSQPNLLKVHILKHKNIRPHKCSDCDMAFYRAYHLKRHHEVYHESSNPPTKKQPYRTVGVRKTPQKRNKPSNNNLLPITTTASVDDSTVSEDTCPKDSPTSTKLTSDSNQQQQIAMSTPNSEETFQDDFVPPEESGSFTFTAYSFTPANPTSADSQD